MNEPRSTAEDQEPDFADYLENGTPMERDLSHQEAAWVYRNLK